MIPSDKNIKSLIKKIQRKCEKNKPKQSKTTTFYNKEIEDTSSEIFDEMSKPAFSE